ncbi:hypothetical protein PILCRDRAFT_299859 [Piloderma croceum F 1598]|uniref:SAP domain-containing protein n=1 Tax=Piloderma croceum (strain F 1598) TaxID=765440 RepID=A0A0C3FSG1_PILCF|nr:hypothetical protein PILCRDRAFT_299859 [Piloderma croceum F 1598]
MLRTALRAHHLRTPIHPLPRYLVSSVLLTRTYENESVAELRKLAKDRGLSPKGNKSTLITRIQEHEQHKTIQAVSSAQDPLVPASVQVRHASSASLATSGSEASSPVPGLPHAAQRLDGLGSTAFTNVNLPDLSQPDPELPTPIVSVKFPPI